MNKVTSTNDYLKQLLSNFKPLPPWTAIMAKMQTEGRGQRGTSWLTVPGQNLTVSIYVKPKNLDVSRQFLLTVITSLALYDTIRGYVSEKRVFIKWPNDIYVESQKICGILIENKISGSQLTASAVGIGLNVYQTVFSAELQKKTTSLKLAAGTSDISLIEIVRRIQHALEGYGRFLTEGKQKELLKQYNERLFQRDEMKPYLLKNSPVEGRIVGVGADGFLQILVDGILVKCDLKDIVYQL